MRKLVVIIIVLGIILGGMVAYQYVVKQENIISIQEIESNIYLARNNRRGLARISGN